jgi:hypothetical protein
VYNLHGLNELKLRRCLMYNNISNAAKNLEIEREKLIAQIEQSIKMALACLIKLEELNEQKEVEN